MTAKRPKTDRSSSHPAPAGAPATAPAAAGPSPALDLRFIREVAKVLAQYRLTEISLDFGDGRIRLRRGAAGGLAAAPGAGAPFGGLTPTAPAPTMAPTTPAADAGLVAITSPFVGTFYAAPSPDAPPYVEVGSRIRPGQVLCIVEAMKLMNEIESEVAGTVVEVLGQAGQPVEYGEALFKVRVE
jgi:acetyl-CoA carboxylase biotin carboxyl carrier protein